MITMNVSSFYIESSNRGNFLVVPLFILHFASKLFSSKSFKKFKKPTFQSLQFHFWCLLCGIGEAEDTNEACSWTLMATQWDVPGLELQFNNCHETWKCFCRKYNFLFNGRKRGLMHETFWWWQNFKWIHQMKHLNDSAEMQMKTH